MRQSQASCSCPYHLGTICSRIQRSVLYPIPKYEIELRELAEFVLEVANSEEYLCSKFEKGLILEIREKMYISGNQSYKEIVQLALRAKKLTSKRLVRGKFQKRKSFGFVSGQFSNKSRSSESSGNSSGLGADSVSSP